MDHRFSETRDARGRTTIEVRDNQPSMLLIWCAIGVVPLFFFESEAWLFVLACVLLFGAFAAWYKFVPRRMRVTIDAPAHMLMVEASRRPRILDFGEIARAQMSTVYHARVPIDPKTPRTELHRVELVLRSGDMVPLCRRHAAFRVAHCERLVAQINTVLGVK